jgi:hypothetical protein
VPHPVQPGHDILQDTFTPHRRNSLKGVYEN